MAEAGADAGSVVRAVREEDLAAVRDVVNWAIENTHYNFNTEPQTTEHWRSEWSGSRERYPWLVATLDGEVAGVAYAGRYKVRRAYDWTAEVTVYVDHRRHRRGVAAALYAELLPILAAQGFHALLGVIALPNPASVALHERFGFVAAGETPQVGWKHGRWWSVGNWQKLLRDGAHQASDPLPVAAALRRLGKETLG